MLAMGLWYVKSHNLMGKELSTSRRLYFTTIMSRISLKLHAELLTAAVAYVNVTIRKDLI